MKHRYFFDQQDYELIRLVDSFREARERGFPSPQLDASLHPHGIIEMGTSYSMRIANALVTLLDSLRDGDRSHRLQALQRLHDEVLHSSQSSLRYNTGRVLIQLMKDLARATSEEQRLLLAHDFHQAAQGTPRVVRRLLARYHLLEMPEEWNQQTFDHHVHDSNTGGRKNPAHLVMDAWVKGIRFLTVIYYNSITPETMDELLHAARIMDMQVRVGIEFKAAYRGRFVDIVWSPSECRDQQQFLDLMRMPAYQDLMREFRPVSQWMKAHTLALLRAWNERLSDELGEELGIVPPKLDEEDFLRVVGIKMPVPLHLAEYIHQSLCQVLPPCQEPGDEQTALCRLTPDTIAEKWLCPARNPDIVFPVGPDPSMPAVMRRAPEVLLAQLGALPHGQVILNLAGLTAADVLELLWRGRGRITHLELFNLREWSSGRLQHAAEINRLQLAINEGSAPELKWVIQEIMAKDTNEKGVTARQRLFEAILRDLSRFQGYYAHTPLGVRMGTDSTSRSHHTHGMGIAFVETLPARVQRALSRRRDEQRLFLPVHKPIYRVREYHRRQETDSFWGKVWNRLLPFLGVRRAEGWKMEQKTARVAPDGNLVTLGGVTKEGVFSDKNRLIPSRIEDLPRSERLCYLNESVASWLKVWAGFLPAQWAFWYTDGWWVLVWFGASLWYLITLGRNIVQAMLSGGAINRTMLLPWKRYVSWRRIADSLLYTGLSVLLLEVGIRVWLLEDACGLTVRNNALAVYTVIALCNGVYISMHNMFRGFPKEAIVGNLFRSAFAVPLSYVMGEGLYQLFALAGVADPMMLTQNCAAITSKCASDTVAAIIEGIADRNQCLRLRYWDYDTKLAQIFACFSRQELLFTHENIQDYFDRPRELWNMVRERDPDAAREAAVNMLDIMYFWYYLPRAGQVFRRRLAAMPAAEKKVLLGMQHLLELEKEISTVLLDGLLGKNFGPALAFYLDYHTTYLRQMSRVARHGGWGQK